LIAAIKPFRPPLRQRQPPLRRQGRPPGLTRRVL